MFLLDEPSANLDYEATQRLLKVIRTWQKVGKTILIAEHRIAWLWDLCDRVIIMDQGRIVQNGDHDSLMEEDGIYRNFICGRQQAVSWKL